MAPRNSLDRQPSPHEQLQVHDEQLALWGLGSVVKNQEVTEAEVADQTEPEDTVEDVIAKKLNIW